MFTPAAAVIAPSASIADGRANFLMEKNASITKERNHEQNKIIYNYFLVAAINLFKRLDPNFKRKLWRLLMEKELIKDELLLDCCMRCEAFDMVNMDCDECQDCPVMKLYNKYKYYKEKDRLRGWDEPKPWKQEMGSC